MFIKYKDQAIINTDNIKIIAKANDPKSFKWCIFFDNFVWIFDSREECSQTYEKICNTIDLKRIQTL